MAAAGLFDELEDTFGDSVEDAGDFAKDKAAKLFDASEQVDFLGLAPEPNSLSNDFIGHEYRVTFSVVRKKDGERIEDGTATFDTTDTTFYNPETGDIDYGSLQSAAQKEINAFSYPCSAIKQSESLDRSTHVEMTITGSNLDSEHPEMRKDALYISEELNSKKFMETVARANYTHKLYESTVSFVKKASIGGGILLAAHYIPEVGSALDMVQPMWDATIGTFGKGLENSVNTFVGSQGQPLTDAQEALNAMLGPVVEIGKALANSPLTVVAVYLGKSMFTMLNDMIDFNQNMNLSNINGAIDKIFDKNISASHTMESRLKI